MKKFIITTTIFLIYSFVFYVVLLYFWGQYASPRFKPNFVYKIGSGGHTYTRLSEVKIFGEVDILFLGSSHAYRGFDTRIFLNNGLKTFNLGSSSQTPIQTKVLLDRYLDRLKPKLVIYEVYPEIFNLDGVESSLDVISNDKNDIQSLKMAFKVNNMKVYNAFIYGFIHDLFGLNKSYYEPVIKGDDKYVSGGFVERKIDFYQPKKLEKREIIFKDYQLAAFSEIIKTLKKQKIPLILVYAPIPKSNYNNYTNNNYFDSIMNRYATYFNFNEIISLNDSLHFYDYHHLNQKGVEKFNKKLIEILRENNAIIFESLCKK